jgi:hypothetical protein
MNGGTTPPIFGLVPPLGPNQCVLATIWSYPLTITVVDINGNPIDSSYNGTNVYEAQFGTSDWLPINQTITNGTYQDPVFVSLGNNGSADPSTWPRYDMTTDKKTIDAWLAATPPSSMGPAAEDVYQLLQVQVAGVTLVADWDPPHPSSAPAIQQRHLTATAPNFIQIAWPNTP